MKRYAAFLRGVSPTNCKMPELKQALEAGGFGDVSTLLSSGNVVFSAPTAPNATLERKLEAAMDAHLGRTFLTIVRPIDALRSLLAADPFDALVLAAGSKRVVTFLPQKPKARVKLPIELHDATIWQVTGGEVFSSYVPGLRGPVFMTLIEKTFGKDLTTRTWDTVKKVASR